MTQSVILRSKATKDLELVEMDSFIIQILFYPANLRFFAPPPVGGSAQNDKLIIIQIKFQILNKL